MAGTQSTPTGAAMEGETPSPLCNHLLEQARLRFEGELPQDQLRTAVAQGLQSLSAAREQTLANLEANEAKDEVLDAFERSFEDMQAAMEELDEFAGNGDDEDAYESVRESIMRAAMSATLAASTMQRAQVADGPTDMPLFNALFKMKEGYLQGGVQGEQLKDALANVVNMTKAAIKELLDAEGDQPPQRDGLVKAYENQIESLEKIDETVSAGGDEVEIEQAFEKLLATSNGVKEAMASLNNAIMSDGPCRLQRTNILLSALESFRSGGLPADAFSESLHTFSMEVREERARFRELAALPNQSAAVAQEIEGVDEAYDLHDEAIGMMEDFLDDPGDPGDLENARKILIDASEMLSDRKEALEELGESEGKIACVRCGSKNDPTFKVCGNCGAQLPQQAGSGMGVASTVSYQETDGQAGSAEGELEMTENLERLFLAVNEIAEERMSDAEFEEVLIWMDGLLAGAQETMPDVPQLAAGHKLSDDLAEHVQMLQEELEEQRQYVITGMDEFRAALGTLQSYFDTRDKETLIAGVRAVRDAALKMQTAQKDLATITETIQKAHEYAQTPEGKAKIEEAAQRAREALEEAHRRAAEQED